MLINKRFFKSCTIYFNIIFLFILINNPVYSASADSNVDVTLSVKDEKIVVSVGDSEFPDKADILAGCTPILSPTTGVLRTCYLLNRNDSQTYKTECIKFDVKLDGSFANRHPAHYQFCGFFTSSNTCSIAQTIKDSIEDLRRAIDPNKYLSIGSASEGAPTSCQSGFQCIGGTCVPGGSSTGAGSIGGGSTGNGSGTGDTIQTCSSDSECNNANAPICDLGQCRPCRSHDQCGGKDPENPILYTINRLMWCM